MFVDQVKKTLGWEPVVPLKEGLALMVEDFAHRLGECTAPVVHTHICQASIEMLKVLLQQLVSALASPYILNMLSQ